MNEKRRERGQSMVIMAVGVLALLALTALIIDGGSIFLNRRRAQTAADAGAMAGRSRVANDNGFQMLRYKSGNLMTLCEQCHQ